MHYGGPDGELAASMRYLSQRYSMPYKEVTGILTDIGREASEMVFSEASAFLAILGLDTVNQLVNGVFYIRHQFLLFEYHCLLLFDALHRRL